MTGGAQFESGRRSSRRDRFVMGLQFTAGLMIAHLIAGKAARDGLFLLHYGPRALPGMLAGSAAFSVVLSLLTGRLMRRRAPQVVLPRALMVSGMLQLAEWWLLGIQPPLASVVIYLHMAGLGAVLLSTFWSMLNEEFDPREAKKRFARITAGGTVGGLIGGLIAERTVAMSGAQALMLVLAGLHLGCGALLIALMRKGATAPIRTDAAGGKNLGFVSPHKSALLRTLATVVLLGSVGAALLDYVFKVYATDQWGRGEGLLRFFAVFHTAVALLSIVLQSVAAKFTLEKFGLRTTILTLPATLAGGSFVALVAPGALVAGIARAAEAAVRNSLFRAGYETCYTPVPAAEKRLVKTFIDVASERGGDALGAGIVYLCIQLAGSSALPWILSIAALVGAIALVLCGGLDRIYLKALARSLESHAVQLKVDSDMDLTTRSLVMRAPVVRQRAPDWQSSGVRAAEGAEPESDPILKRLMTLRSSDVGKVQVALNHCDISDRLVATQVCLLLGRDEYALVCHAALSRSAGKVLGLLTDLLLDTSLEVSIRRRLPRIIGSVPGQRSANALLAGLEDPRFEVRSQCARTLAKLSALEPRAAISAAKILGAVDRELAIGTLLWESHRKQQRESSESGEEWLDEVLRDKAHAGLEYVFALLSLLHDRGPLMAAFRSLHLDDRYLRGTALEYLEGILPAKTREMLWEILQEQPSQSAGRAKSEIMQELLNSSETVVLHIRRNALPGTNPKA